MTDPRATKGRFGDWNHPNIRIADARLNFRRQHAKRRAIVLFNFGEPVPKIAEWLDIPEADLRAVLGLDGPEAA